MTKQVSTPSAEILAEVLAGASNHELLRFAVLCRDTYVQEVAATRAKLDPKRLRGLDAKIAELRAAIN